jgi:hypothetical protein
MPLHQEGHAGISADPFSAAVKIVPWQPVPSLAVSSYSGFDHTNPVSGNLGASASSVIAGIIMARNLDVADDLFGGPQGSPRTDKMIAAAVQWAERIMKKVDVIVGN